MRAPDGPFARPGVGTRGAHIESHPLEGLTDEHEAIRFTAERDLELLLTEIETTMIHMYANRVTDGGGLLFIRVKERESAMMTSFSSKGSCNNCKSPVTQRQLLKIPARVCGGIIVLDWRGKDRLVQLTQH